ncbi:MAG: imidazole glycerol phosphate synthase subunit HisF [Deltaproteobacteria bacterium]|nr:imidazole glycerol phosphate synthase subunit HisF [Deltaproteobacteria bacterium]
MITLLDYGAGNVRSVVNSIGKLGHQVKMVSTPKDILDAERLIFPGVGSFGSMMRILEQRGYVAPLKEYLAQNRPFLGICLGMQALLEGSEESPGVPGLGYIKGNVKRFQVELAVPHIGWNGILPRQESILFKGLEGSEKFYFVHSFYIDPEDETVVLTRTDYGQNFVSAVQKGNVIGTQFHPEKSGDTGLAVLKNFIENREKAMPATVVQRETRLAKRIIACLDVRSNDDGDLVVTKGDQYDVREEGEVRNLGAPVELAQRYYNEGADEITFLNITGFRDFPLKDMPMLEVLKRTSENVFVPLTIGGGIRDYTDETGRKWSALEVASEYFRSGADKVSIGSDAVYVALAYLKSGQKTGASPIETISEVYGSQAVVISVDPRRVYVSSPKDVPHQVIETAFPGPNGEKYCWYECTVKGGREGAPIDAITLSQVTEKLGAGEILLNCIDKDGTNSGFDIELISAVKKAVTIPVIASSGAGEVAHFTEVFEKTNVESALAAGIFHRREVPIEAVKEHLGTSVEIRK